MRAALNSELSGGRYTRHRPPFFLGHCAALAHLFAGRPHEDVTARPQIVIMKGFSPFWLLSLDVYDSYRAWRSRRYPG